MKSLRAVVFGLVGSLLCVSAVLAAGEDDAGRESTTGMDEIVAACEKQFSNASYPDEEERTALINQCVEQKSNDSGQDNPNQG
jgi:hypothetical protein